MLPVSIPASRSLSATAPASRRSMPGISTLSRVVMATSPLPNSSATRTIAAICDVVITPAGIFPPARRLSPPSPGGGMTPCLLLFFLSVMWFWP